MLLILDMRKVENESMKKNGIIRALESRQIEIKGIIKKSYLFLLHRDGDLYRTNRKWDTSKQIHLFDAYMEELESIEKGIESGELIECLKINLNDNLKGKQFTSPTKDKIIYFDKEDSDDSVNEIGGYYETLSGQEFNQEEYDSVRVIVETRQTLQLTKMIDTYDRSDEKYNKRYNKKILEGAKNKNA